MIFDPLRNDLFTASRGSGATLNDKRIRVAERKDLNGAHAHHRLPAARAQERRRPAQVHRRCCCSDAEDIRRTGSAALDLAYVACGRADAYFEAGVKPWDIAAGVLMVREAGGQVVDFRGRSHRPDGHPRPRRPPAGRRQPEDLRRAAEKIVSTGYATALD